MEELDQFGNHRSGGHRRSASDAVGDRYRVLCHHVRRLGIDATIPSGSSTTPFYFGDESLGSQTITASASGVNSGTQIGDEITLVSASASQSTVSANPTSVTANGTSTSMITVTAEDGFGNPVANQVITLGAGSGASVITTLSGTTNASGVATFSVKDATAQSVAYTATDVTGSIGCFDQADGYVRPRCRLGRDLDGRRQPDLGQRQRHELGTATITVTAKDANGNAVPGNTITLGQGGGNSLITTVSGTTNASGVATFTVVDNSAEVVTYTATDSADSVSFTPAPVTFISDPASASVSTVVASPTSGLLANGSTPSTITVTVKDSAGNPVANQAISIAHTGSSVVLPRSRPRRTRVASRPSQRLTPSPRPSPTPPPTQPAQSAFTATPTVTFTTGVASASASTVVAKPRPLEWLPTARHDFYDHGDADGSPTATRSPATSSRLPRMGRRSSRRCRVRRMPVRIRRPLHLHDLVAQTVTYTAKDTTSTPQLTLTTTPTVNFVAGAANAGTSTVQQTPTVGPCSPTAFLNTTIGVTIKDVNNGNDRVGDNVTLTANSGTSSVITTVSATTNINGYASFTVADNTAQTVTYTAHDITASPNVTVTQTASVTFTTDTPSVSGHPTPKSTVGASLTPVIANGTATSTITVTIEDASGNPIANQTITLAHTGSSVVTPASAVTSALPGQLGEATFSVTDTAVQTVTYTATDVTDSNAVLSSTASVAFVAGSCFGLEPRPWSRARPQESSPTNLRPRRSPSPHSMPPATPNLVTP